MSEIHLTITRTGLTDSFDDPVYEIERVDNGRHSIGQGSRVQIRKDLIDDLGAMIKSLEERGGQVTITLALESEQ